MFLEGVASLRLFARRLNLLAFLYSPLRARMSADRRGFLEADIGSHDAQQSLYMDGNLERTREMQLDALRRDPDCVPAITLLTQWGYDGAIEKAISYVTDWGKMSALNKWERAAMWYAIAAYQERHGHYDRAWPCYQHAGTAIAEAFPYDQDGLDFTVDTVSRNLDRRTVHCFHGNFSRKPIFIVGLPRSGTTLLETMLAGHPSVHPMGELDFMTESLNASGFQIPVTQWMMRRVGWRYMAKVATRDPRSMTHARFTDKMPDNWQVAPAIAMALPNAKIVWMQRDPMDNLVSAWRTPLFRHGWTGSFESLAHKWRAKERALAHCRTAIPRSTLLVVNYEDLVKRPKDVMGEVLDHVGLPWDGGVLHPERVDRTITTASTTQARSVIHSGSVGKWSHIYADQLAPLKELITRPIFE